MPLENETTPSRIGSGCMVRWLIAGVVLFFALNALIRPIFLSGPTVSKENVCNSHLKAIGTGVAMYAQDWDERLPLAHSWASDLQSKQTPYVQRDDLRCASAQSPFGYALNRKVAGKSLDELPKLSEHIMIFESDSQTQNESGGAEKLPAQPRHVTRDLYALLDGHTKASARPANVKW